MIIILKKNPEAKQLENLKAWLIGQKLTIHESKGESHMILGLGGDTSAVDIDLLRALDIVEDVKRVQEPYKNANRKFHEEDTIIPVGNTQIGGGIFTLIAGPCSIETEQQICGVAEDVKASGATMLRRGVQAAYFALLVSGAARGRAEAVAGSQTLYRASGSDGNYGY